jgi:hypothetical protein
VSAIEEMEATGVDTKGNMLICDGKIISCGCWVMCGSMLCLFLILHVTDALSPSNSVGDYHNPSKVLFFFGSGDPKYRCSLNNRSTCFPAFVSRNSC